MRRYIILASFLLFSSVAKGQDFFEDELVMIVMPTDRNELQGFLPFLKQFTVVRNADLFKSDTILFYVNDSLKNTLDITNWRNRTTVDYADSLAKARRDSVLNDQLNSYDFYFKNQDGTKRLEARKYLNEKHAYSKKEILDFDGSIRSIITWEYDSRGKILSETMKNNSTNTIFKRSWYRKNNVVTQKVIEMSRLDVSSYKTTINFNKNGDIVGYKLVTDHNGKTCLEKFKVDRDRDNSVKKISGLTCKTPVEFTVSYSGNDTNISRRVDKKVTKFKITLIPTSN